MKLFEYCILKTNENYDLTILQNKLNQDNELHYKFEKLTQKNINEASLYDLTEACIIKDRYFPNGTIVVKIDCLYQLFTNDGFIPRFHKLKETPFNLRSDNE